MRPARTQRTAGVGLPVTAHSRLAFWPDWARTTARPTVALGLQANSPTGRTDQVWSASRPGSRQVAGEAARPGRATTASRSPRRWQSHTQGLPVSRRLCTAGLRGGQRCILYLQAG